MDMYHICMLLFKEFYDGHSTIRHVYVTLDNLYDKAETQLDLFENRSKKMILAMSWMLFVKNMVQLPSSELVALPMLELH